MTTRTRQLVSLGMVSILMLAGCSTAEPGGQDPAPSAPATSASASSQPPSSPEGTAGQSSSSASETPQSPAPSGTPDERSEAETLVGGMGAEAQAASLVMAGVPATGASRSELTALQEQGIWNVFLRGRSQLSVPQTAEQVEKITGALERSTPGNLPAWVATDQEGGFVRVLQGPGFTELPTALKQGAWSEKELASKMASVGSELAEAGINVNLAPVADIVPSSIGTANAPIGYFGRQYAGNAADAARKVLAVNQALDSAGVQPVVKHFPGLGRVRANTDTSSSVTDTVTGPESEDLQPFTEAISQGLSWVMISNARYTKIDAKNDAPFSSALITGLLRERLGYEGLVISDDLCEAEQVASVPVAQRAVDFVAAGGTMPLCVNAKNARAMAAALASEAEKDKDFAAQVREAAILVLQEKLESR